MIDGIPTTLHTNDFIDYLIKETSYHEDPFIINYLSILNSWPCAPIMRIIYAIYLYVFDTRIPLKTIYSQTLKATKGIREASIYLCPWLHIMAHWDLCSKFIWLYFLCNCNGVLCFQTSRNRIYLFVVLLFSYNGISVRAKFGITKNGVEFRYQCNIFCRNQFWLLSDGRLENLKLRIFFHFGDLILMEWMHHTFSVSMLLNLSGGFGIGYGISQKYWPIRVWFLVSNLDQNRDFVHSLNGTH